MPPFPFLVVFWLLGTAYFYLLPLVSFLIPFIVSYFVLKLSSNRKIPFSSLVPYGLTVSVLVIAANIFWQMFLVNKVYYEWDTLPIKYSLFTFEYPILDQGPSWIAPGWSQWHIFAIWLGITMFIYTSASFVVLLLNRKAKNIDDYKKAIIKISVILSILSLAAISFVGLILIGFWGLAKFLAGFRKRKITLQKNKLW